MKIDLYYTFSLFHQKQRVDEAEQVIFLWATDKATEHSNMTIKNLRLYTMDMMRLYHKLGRSGELFITYLFKQFCIVCMTYLYMLLTPPI